MLGIIQCKKGVGYCSHDKLLLNIKNKGNVTLPCNTFSAFPLSSVLCFLSKAPDFTLRLGSESHSIVWLRWVTCIVWGSSKNIHINIVAVGCGGFIFLFYLFGWIYNLLSHENLGERKVTSDIFWRFAYVHARRSNCVEENSRAAFWKEDMSNAIISSIKRMIRFFLGSYGTDNFRLGTLPNQDKLATKTNWQKRRQPRARVCACGTHTQAALLQDSCAEERSRKRKGERLSESSLLFSQKIPNRLFKK